MIFLAHQLGHTSDEAGGVVAPPFRRSLYRYTACLLAGLLGVLVG